LFKSVTRTQQRLKALQNEANISIVKNASKILNICLRGSIWHSCSIH